LQPGLGRKGMALDTLRIEARGIGGSLQGTGEILGSFEDWTSFSLRTSMVEPAELSLELGDDTGWTRLNAMLQLGSEFQVFLGDRPRMRGRVEAIDSTGDAGSSATQRLVIRTKMSDAIYSSAPQGIRLKGATLKQFILACYSSLGLTEADFDFRGDVSRDLLTGVRGKGRRAPVNLDALSKEDAKVNPPETIFAAVDRHLRRHGMLHWDGPDGRIVVAAPDDTQDPTYYLQTYRSGSSAQLNNIKSLQRIFDVSGSPTTLGIYGKGGAVDFSKVKLGAVLFNAELQAAGFRRAVVLVDEGLRNLAAAQRRAAREFASRNRGLQRIMVVADGLTYREGSTLIPYAPDTVVDVVSDPHGGPLGAFYLETVELSRSVDEGDNTTMSLVQQGVWVL
jgi:prophage tail gpP-like protein